jgi:16S rRNA (guanine(966)-N(2))-methyltransferase RsmD
MKGTARPTAAKIISALFNILRSSSLCGAPFLDLFAGTGSVAWHAIGQGAERVLCVESNADRANAISRKFADAGLAPERASCVKSDVRRALPRLAQNAPPREFGVVFADPPYCAGWGAALPHLVAANWGAVKQGGVFVFEHSSREPVVYFLTERDDRIYGDTVLSFYWKREVSES